MKTRILLCQGRPDEKDHESHESTRIGVVGTRIKKIREDSVDSWLISSSK